MSDIKLLFSQTVHIVVGVRGCTCAVGNCRKLAVGCVGVVYGVVGCGLA